jgi:hypothetical protein
MRLLYVGSDGTLCCTKDYIVEQEIPPYAILSHTWKEGQEITFDHLNHLDNVEDITTQHNEGYQKIRFCAQQAKRDNIGHFWIDTCCIDKSNHVELSRAINSMFRWYRNAEKCYVYLADVRAAFSDKEHESEKSWESKFRKSRWFTRGWTLQELLAPRNVEFYTVEGERLGDRESLEHSICEVTGIPKEALSSGCSLTEFSIDERLSWAARRQTTHEEDGAYCLLGIFGIHLPLIYGEGKDNAHKRLKREIRQSQEDEDDGNIASNSQSSSEDQEERRTKLSKWLAAPDPSTNYHKAHQQRQADTGLWLLEDKKFTTWKAEPSSLLWLYGIPGCGKTILSSTIIENLLQHCRDAPGMATVYFYFDFKDTEKQNPDLMVRSLLYQLLQQCKTIPLSLDTLFASYGIGRQPSLQALLKTLQRTMEGFNQIYIVLDALDECNQRIELMSVLKIVAGWQNQDLHLLMTSRKEQDIESSMEDFLCAENYVYLQSDRVDTDIQLYVKHRLSYDKTLIKWGKETAVRQEIEARLLEGAHGM